MTMRRLFGMTVLCAHIGSAASIVAQIRTESRGFCKCLPCRFIQPAIVGADSETALKIAQEGISICGIKSRNPKSFVQFRKVSFVNKSEKSTSLKDERSVFRSFCPLPSLIVLATKSGQRNGRSSSLSSRP